jgi:RNA-directed DNA polymerase
MSDIIKAQQGLARKAQANKAHQFRDLYHLLCRREWIEEALRHVLNNDGAQTPGVDGMSWKDFNDAEKSDFANEKFRQHFIDEIQSELKTGTFQPMPVRRVEIPKPGTNKTRPLGIPTVKDRTVQMLLKMVLEPIWEADFYYFSNGFRPGRCTMDCIQPLYKLCGTKTGYRWVIEGDVRACFDKIPHDRLVEEVARRIADTKVLTLIRRFLKSGIMIERTLVPSEEGTPQGGICSPVLANIYLHRFDEWYSQHYAAPDQKADPRGYHAWKKQRAKGSDLAAVQMFRYADDWILVIRGTKTQAQDIKEACKTFLRDELGLELSEEKTKITHIEEGFEFLGFRIFRCNKASNRRKVGVFVRPTDKGLKRVQVKIKAMTTRSTLNDDYVYKIQAINAVIRGWATYYRAVNPTETFNKLDRYVWLRLKKWLEKKYEIGPKEVKRRYMSHQPGPKGGRDEFAAQETDETWVWRYRATQTKLIYHRPTIKRHWPHPYLEKVKVEQYVLPTMKDMWQGNSAAPMYAANRREVLKRATGACERCGRATKLTVHHRHRVKWNKKPMQADHRPEGMEALCKSCHVKEHRAELVYRMKQIPKKQEHTS